MFLFTFWWRPPLVCWWHTAFYLIPTRCSLSRTHNLHVTISAISDWMASNFLSLNPSKTEFLLIGMPIQLSKLHNQSLLLPDNTTIAPVHSARNLGIIFDSNLSFDSQISSLSKACYFHIRDLRRIRRTLDSDTARIVATSLVQSKLDYCNSLYHEFFLSHRSNDSRQFRTHWLAVSLLRLGSTT